MSDVEEAITRVQPVTGFEHDSAAVTERLTGPTGATFTGERSRPLGRPVQQARSGNRTPRVNIVGNT